MLPVATHGADLTWKGGATDHVFIRLMKFCFLEWDGATFIVHCGTTYGLWLD